MAIKIFISGNSLRANDTQTSVELMDVPKNDVYYFNQALNNGNIKIGDIPLNDSAAPKLEIALSDAVDEDLVAFTAETFRTFCNVNLGNVDALSTGAINSEITGSDSIALVKSLNEDEIMIGNVEGRYIVQKYAKNDDVDSASDIWSNGGDYTGFPTTAAEEFQVNGGVNDSILGTGARTVRFFYFDDDYKLFDVNGDLLYFDTDMNGETYVNSGVTGMRIWTGKVLTSGSSQTNEEDINCRWATTTTAIFAGIPAGFGQTQISNFTIPLGYEGYLKIYLATMDDNNANSGELAIKVRTFDSNTFRIIRPKKLSTIKNIEGKPYGGIPFEEKDDFCFRCTDIDNINGKITIEYSLLLVKK